MLKLKVRKLKVSMSLLLTVLMMVSLLAMSLLAIGYSPPEPEPPVRYGAWPDAIVGIIVDKGIAVPMLKAGDLHIFTGAIPCAEIHAGIKAHPQAEYERLFGVFHELTLNPAGTPEDPTFADGRMNPFAQPRIREAINWLIDRTYVAEELYGGMAMPRYFPIHPAFPDYARYIAKARYLELYYAYDFDRAKAVIHYEMKALGAELVDGIWHWEVDEVLGPVELIILIRIEDKRLPLGHYVTAQMERVGFKTKPILGTAGELGPKWIHPDPYLGKFHMVTGGWIATVISRDQGGVFDFFYTERGIPLPLWAKTKPSPEFDELALRLGLRDFACLDERKAMFERALVLAMQDSHRIWVVNTIGAVPRRYDVSLAADLAGGIAGGWLFGRTVRFVDPVTGEPIIGGTIKLGTPTILVDPWNPIAGSNWIWDWQFMRATIDYGALPDPFTGLWHPQRVERAEVCVLVGTPIGVTLDWVDLQFVDVPIDVPADAWVDWCAVEQRFITLAEAMAKPDFDLDRLFADARVRVHYPADMFDTVTWHDGSPLTIGDFVMSMIFDLFDRANPDSENFDPAKVARFATFMEHFRGLRIVSQDPLIIESFTNMVPLDAEVMAAGWTWFPTYFRGQVAWHTLTPAILAERAEELAFGAPKAAGLEVEWMSFVSGPSLPILERHLGEAKAVSYLPFAPTLGEFITPAEVAARYAALTNWVEEKGHFWVNLGPFMLRAVHPIEKIVHLVRFPYFTDPADRWIHFVTPMIAEVDVIGPAVVHRGTEAVFDVVVTFEDEPYLIADVDFVTYILIDAKGVIVYVGTAVAVEDGLWRVVLPGEKTAGLAIGSTRLEIAVAPLVVAIPSFDAATFVLLP